MATTATQQAALLEQLPSPHPPVQLQGEVLTPEQWETLIAILDTCIPAIAIGDSPSSTSKLLLSSTEYAQTLDGIKSHATPDASTETVEAYLAESCMSSPLAKPFLARMLADYVRPAERADLASLLSNLGYAYTNPSPSIYLRSLL